MITRSSTRQWVPAVSKNGIEIMRLGINVPLKVINIDKERLLERLGVNLNINVGDIVESINFDNAERND